MLRDGAGREGSSGPRSRQTAPEHEPNPQALNQRSGRRRTKPSQRYPYDGLPILLLATSGPCRQPGA